MTASSAERKRKRKEAGPVPVDRATAYARDVAAGRIVAGLFVRQACNRHLADQKRKDLRWDREKSERAIAIFETCYKLDSGEPFTLQPFQCFIVGSVFGWYGLDGLRRFRTAYVEIGKGNGKTPMAAGIGLIGLVFDDEGAAEVYSAAATQDQASIAFKDAKRIVEGSPDLAAMVDVQVGSLFVQATNSVFRPVSAEHRGLDGKRVHIAIVDELHEHASALVVDKIRAGTKGRKNALILEITNSGYDRRSVCWAHHEYSRQVLDGSAPNDSWFAYVTNLDGSLTSTLDFVKSCEYMLTSCSCENQIAIPTGNTRAEASATSAISFGTVQTQAGPVVTRSGLKNRAGFAQAATAKRFWRRTLNIESDNELLSKNGRPEIASALAHTGPSGEKNKAPNLDRRKRGLCDSEGLESLWNSLNESRLLDVEFAGAGTDIFASITTTLQTRHGDSCAPHAIVRSVISETLSSLYDGHSPTCSIRLSSKLNADSLTVEFPADDWADEKVWIKANPGLGTILPWKYLREQVTEAKGMPSKENIVKRLNFCVWTEQSTRWLPMEEWDRGAREIKREGRCFAGLDLGSTSDFSARCLLWGPDADGEWSAEWRMWIPEARADERIRKGDSWLAQAIADGWIETTPGNVTDYDYIEKAVLDDFERHDIEKLAFDRWNASQLITHLMGNLGEDRLVKFGQGFVDMSPACRELERRLKGGLLRHGGNPVMRWMASNASAKSDPAGNIKPDKEASADKIDGIVALLDAIGAETRTAESGGSYYDKTGGVIEAW